MPAKKWRRKARNSIGQLNRIHKTYLIYRVYLTRMTYLNNDIGINDVVNIYISIFRPGNENLRIGLNNVLKQFLVKLLERDFTQQIEDHEISVWKKVISEHIAENKKVSPYFDLPDTERTILNDMTSFLEKVIMRKYKERCGNLQQLSRRNRTI